MALPTLGATAPQQIVASVNLPDPGKPYRAQDHLPKGTAAAELVQYATDLAANTDLNNVTFMALVKDFGDLSTTPGLDAMLKAARGNKSGQAGVMVVDTVQKMRHFGQTAPRLKDDFKARLREGKAKVSEVLDQLNWLGRQIERYAMGYQSLESLIDERQAFFMEQYNLSLEATVRDIQLASEENRREEALIRLTAILEFLEPAIAKQLSVVTEDVDKVRLQGVAQLVIARRNTFIPLIQMANVSMKRFAVQSNSNALTAMKQLDFATVVIANWKSQVAAQLDAIQNVARNLAYLDAEKYQNEQALASARAFDEQVTSMVEMMKSSVLSLDTITAVTESLVNAGETLTKALEEAKNDGEAAAKTIEQNRKKVAASEDKMRQELQRILGAAA